MPKDIQKRENTTIVTFLLSQINLLNYKNEITTLLMNDVSI